MFFFFFYHRVSEFAGDVGTLLLNVHIVISYIMIIIICTYIFVSCVLLSYILLFSNDLNLFFKEKHKMITRVMFDQAVRYL